MAKAEKFLGVNNLYDPSNIEILHAVNQALRAHTLFHRDKEYIVKDGEVTIVDEFTGRLMSGRRWSDGLHQAVEAKEKVKIQSENQTLATVTLQNYFRMYDKLAGMTGTAETEAEEFEKIYGLDVAVVPTNMPMVRADHGDVVYKTEKEKFRAVIEEIAECHETGQPVLVGTVSIENSERLAKLLQRRKVKHVVLNAKYHEREADIIAQAGRLGAVTIATNMAGRGTDIVLGGNPEGLASIEANAATDPEKYEEALKKYEIQCAEEKQQVLEAGGLHILGTERHESRRIDNQLRGRSGRQGDPGSSRFFLSLEDDLMRIFASDWVRKMMDRLGMEEDIPIESKMVSKSIERAQTQVEGRNFEVRKHLLEYDDVMNKQRVAVYKLRRNILEGVEGRNYILRVVDEILDSLIDEFCPEEADPEDWDREVLREGVPELLRPHDGRTRDRLGHHQPAAARNDSQGRGGRALRETGGAIRRRGICPAREIPPARHRRPSVEGPPAGARSPAGGNRPQSLRPAQSAGRVQTRVLCPLRRHVGADRGPRGEVPLPRRTGGGHAAAAAPCQYHAFPPRGAGPRDLARPAGEGGQYACRLARRETDDREAQSTEGGRNDPCPCGSGKKYKRCHGAAEAGKG